MATAIYSGGIGAVAGGVYGGIETDGSINGIEAGALIGLGFGLAPVAAEALFGTEALQATLAGYLAIGDGLLGTEDFFDAMHEFNDLLGSDASSGASSVDGGDSFVLEGGSYIIEEPPGAEDPLQSGDGYQLAVGDGGFGSDAAMMAALHAKMLR